MGSKAAGGIRRFPQVEGKVRKWLWDEYVTRGLTGPMTIDNHEVSKGTGSHVGTTSSALLALSRDGTEGLRRLTPGTYNYEPPTVIKAQAAKPAPARTLDMTVRPRLIRYARDTWLRERKPTLVVAKVVAGELGLHVGSTQGAMGVLARDYPGVGYQKIAAGVYEIVKPDSVREVEQAVQPEPEAQPDVRPQVPVVLTQEQVSQVVADMTPQVHAGSSMDQAVRPLGVPFTPSPEQVAARNALHEAEQAMPSPALWELKTQLSEGRVLQQADDGTYWVARKLDLS